MPKRKTFSRASAKRRSPQRAPTAASSRAGTSAPGAPARRAPADGDAYWLYGAHAVTAALANPRRRLLRVLCTGETAAAVERLLAAPGRATDRPAVERVDRATLGQLLPQGAVHQGLAARVAPLPPIGLHDACEAGRQDADATILLLDQVTDPHNVGAILRSAAAFGATAVVLTERNAAPESGALAKAASGALEHVPLVRVTNLARAMEELKQADFWCVGLAAEAADTVADADLSGRIALVLGSEGSGLRRLTRERCDRLVRLPTAGPIADLNVSNAAAVALYERARSRADRSSTPRPTATGSAPSR